MLCALMAGKGMCCYRQVIGKLSPGAALLLGLQACQRKRCPLVFVSVAFPDLDRHAH